MKKNCATPLRPLGWTAAMLVGTAGLWNAATGGQEMAVSRLPAGAEQQESVRMVERLRASLRECEAALRRTESQITTMTRTVESLSQQVQSIQPPRTKPPAPPAPEKSKNVRYRPPMEQIVKGKKTLRVLCESNRVAAVDFSPILAQLNSMEPNKKTTISLDLGDYHAEGDVKVTAGRGGPEVDGTVKVVRKPGTAGESSDDLQRPGSTFRQTLDKYPPDKYILDFEVWPDSHQVFRDARAIAWEKNYGLDWTPNEAGKALELRFGTGGGMGTIQ